MNISNRLKNVALMVTPGNKIADIGTDHGYVPMFLIKNKIVPYAIAMDINRGPLERADRNIRQAGLEDKIETRLSNGLEKLKSGEADTVIIAGMGGELIAEILQKSGDVLDSVSELVVSPHSFPENVRNIIPAMGFAIVDEKMIYEDGKYYVIIKSRKGTDEQYSDAELKFGRILLQRQDEILKKYMESKIKKLKQIKEKIGNDASDSGYKRMKEISDELDIISDAFKYYN